MNELEMKVADAIAKIFYRASMDKLEWDENLSAIHNCWEAQRAVIPIVTDSIRQAIEGIDRPKAILCDIDKYPKKTWDTAHSFGWRDGFNEAIQAVLRIIGGCP